MVHLTNFIVYSAVDIISAIALAQVYVHLALTEFTNKIFEDLYKARYNAIVNAKLGLSAEQVQLDAYRWASWRAFKLYILLHTAVLITQLFYVCVLILLFV